MFGAEGMRVCPSMLGAKAVRGVSHPAQHKRLKNQAVLEPKVHNRVKWVS